jgi:hypothetical protein
MEVRDQKMIAKWMTIRVEMDDFKIFGWLVAHAEQMGLLNVNPHYPFMHLKTNRTRADGDSVEYSGEMPP